MDYSDKKQQGGWRKTWRFVRPIVIAASVTLLAFFFLQGLSLIHI